MGVRALTYLKWKPEVLKITPKPPRTGKIGSHGMNEGEVHMQRQNRRWGERAVNFSC